MNEILLTDTIPSHADLERLHLFAGRHMGEEEFDRQQAYMDRRMAPLLAHAHPGVIHGLQVRVGEFSSGQEGFTVSPGLALAGNGQSVGLYYPLRESWSTLIEDYLKETGAADASGVYYLTLRRSNRYIDADPNVKPCHRDEFDPTRDARRVLVGTLGLKRLSIDSMAVSAYSRERIENWVAANHVDGNFLESMYNAVPIGLLAVENTGVDEDGQPIYGVSWFSEEAGRYHAIADSGYHVLLQQVTNAFRRILLSADEVVDDDYTLQDYINDKLHLDFLPAAGELPKELILDIASTSPGVTWLPNHLAVDMLAVPEESVNELIERHLPRRVIDLRQPSGDRVRLLLTVNEPDYKPDLLDYPQTDQRLHDDIFRYYMRAYNVWAQWMGKFNQLYFLTEEDILDAEQLAILELPDPLASPQLPEDFFQQVIDESVQELGRDADEQLHYPYRLGVPPYPVFYRSWGLVDESLPDGPVLPPPVEDPEQDGLVIRYTIGQVELEALDNEIRAIRARLEKTRDYLLLQRQQLDSQTVSLAALAGGVAGDGSGLQVARWLPFSKLTAASVEATAEPPEEAPSIPLTSRNVSLAPFSFAHISSIADTARSLTSKVSEAQQAATKNNFVFSSTLRKTPTALSTLQFTLNNQRLDRITEASKVAITRPAFEAKEFRFGVLEHIRPEIQEYKKAIRGMRELITTVEGLFDPNESRSIKAQLNKFGSPKSLEQLSLPNSTLTSEQLAPVLYESLFEAGKILTQQIAYMEGRYARIEANLEGKLRSRVNQEARQDKLIALIRRATEQLENIDKRRIEYLGDYGVAQRLLDDDWLNVYKQNLERTRILTTGVKGLYFVRERQAPITQALADPLPLRYGKAGDIVPGCDWVEDPELPDELEDFFDTVLEIPMADWSVLKDLQVYVPPPHMLEYIANLRNVRFQNKARKQRRFAASGRPVRSSLSIVRSQTHALLDYLARRRIQLEIRSARKRAEEAAKVMSLDDIIASGRGRLKAEAQTLHNHLEQALACLLDKLIELPPSVRLLWQQFAEDDRLLVEQVERWPGLERAERDDFIATRTLAELVAWWFRQLDQDASAQARSAMRNMIRAAVIHSALGDPTEILQGQVHMPPRRLAVGEPLRIKLNRPAKPGTILQLMDQQQRVVAMLNVEDDDDKGTIANITRVTYSSASITTAYRVVASKATGKSL